MTGYNFTDRVRRVLERAREESKRLRHEYVGTEHLLLALIAEDDGVARNVFRNLGVKTEEIVRLVDNAVQPGRQGAAIPVDLPYTPRARKALELAMHSARDLRHGYVGSEHLLLGLLREKTGLAAQALMQAGLSESAARDEVVRLVGEAKRQGVPRAIVSVKLEIEVEGSGSLVKEKFEDIESAIAFLRRVSID